MATKFPKFSQDLAQDPTTRRIWYAMAMGNDFESHDGMTEENLYQRIFATHFGHVAIIFLWTSSLLFHVAWQGNFQQWIKDPFISARSLMRFGTHTSVNQQLKLLPKVGLQSS
jgi:photosystem I P700 chlorophyll a apoprotein A2